MERAHGGELFDRIKALGNYSEEAARRTFVNILSAVVHLHEQVGAGHSSTEVAA